MRLTLEIVRRSDHASGFVVLPTRWVVECTLSWLMCSRRLVRDYETLPACMSSLAGTELSNFIQGERVLQGDYYVLQITA